MKATPLLSRIGIILLIAITIFACKKDLTTLGLDLVSPGDLIRMGYSDTIQISAYSVQEDSTKTGNLSYAMIGSMNDPVFGKTHATFYTQIRISTEPTDLGKNLVVDSAFLILPYTSGYGDTLSNMTLRVYELAEDIVDTVHLYSNHTLAYNNNEPLGSLTFTPRPHDSAYYNGAKQAPAIRIPLNEKFGSRIEATDTTDLATNKDFLAFFKGVAIVADRQDNIDKGCLLKFSLTSGKSRILMYYHNSTDTSSYSFLINSDCDRFNSFDHENYNGASNMLLQEVGGDTTLGQQFLFLQAMGGVRVKLKFPHLKNWADKEHVLINDAQLILTNAMPSNVFTPPASLVLYPMTSDGTLYPYLLPDASETFVDHDGYYSSDDNTYRFRIPHYVQQVLNGDQTDYGLFLLIPASSVNSERLVLHGPDSGSSSLKLYVKYTLVN